MGEKRRAELRKHFGTIKAIREADVETLAAVVPRAAAQAVWEHFHPKTRTSESQRHSRWLLREMRKRMQPFRLINRS